MVVEKNVRLTERFFDNHYKSHRKVSQPQCPLAVARDVIRKSWPIVNKDLMRSRLDGHPFRYKICETSIALR